MKIINQKMGENQDSLVIDYRKKKATGRLRVTGFEDNGHHIAYIASLNLSGYGDNLEAAIKMLMEIVVDDFLDNLLSLPEYKVSEEMANLGWHRGKIFKKKFTSDSFVDNEGILRNFNLSPETKISEQLLVV